MLKYVPSVLFGLLIANTSIAAQPVTPAPLKWLPGMTKASQQNEIQQFNSQTQSDTDESATDGYAEFSGSWTGQCEVEGGDEIVEDINVNFDITADRDNLKFYYEGDVYNYKIGEDKSIHNKVGNGFMSVTYVFNWLDKSTLSFNSTYLASTFRNHVESALVRVTFSREGDTLTVANEYDSLVDNQSLEHIKGVCKFVKQG